MAFRTPRGYAVNRPQYQELSEGVRPEASTIPMAAWTGLPAVRVDEVANDPIVLDAGTIVGIATGGNASGQLFPAHDLGGWTTGGFGHDTNTDNATAWGLPSVSGDWEPEFTTGGAVRPLGVVYSPIYSFRLQALYSNYKRNENVGVVTDYMIQVPCLNSHERAIKAGELVCVNWEARHYGISIVAGVHQIGRYRKFDNDVNHIPLLVGRCFKTIQFARGTTAIETLLSADIANVSLTDVGLAEFKGLDKVQTVPGLGLAGSGTKGVPSWLTKARSDGDGLYYALTLLIRL